MPSVSPASDASVAEGSGTSVRRPTVESDASAGHKAMIVESDAADIVHTPFFTGVRANYLRESILRTGLDPDALPERDASSMDYSSGERPKAWKDVWSAGQGVGSVLDVPTVAELVERMVADYRDATGRIARGRRAEPSA